MSCKRKESRIRRLLTLRGAAGKPPSQHTQPPEWADPSPAPHRPPPGSPVPPQSRPAELRGHLYTLRTPPPAPRLPGDLSRPRATAAASPAPGAIASPEAAAKPPTARAGRRTPGPHRRSACDRILCSLSWFDCEMKPFSSGKLSSWKKKKNNNNK